MAQYKIYHFEFILLMLIGFIRFNVDAAANKASAHSQLEFFHLGTVNGKGYYSESTTEMVWFQSKELCEERNMTLATIATPAEYDFLKSIDDYDHFYNLYWTGGRDAQEFRQYSWDNDGEQVGDFLQFWRTGRPPLTCLVIVGAKNYWVEDRPCTQQAQTLCQKTE